MGLYWETVTSSVDVNEVSPANILLLEGDVKAWKKHWWNDPFWRIQHNFVSLQILSPFHDEFEEGFRMYFSSEGIVMRYRKLVHTPYVVVRQAHEDVFFWAVDSNGNECALRHTRVVLPALLRKQREDDFSEAYSSFCEQTNEDFALFLGSGETHTWI